MMTTSTPRPVYRLTWEYTSFGGRHWGNQQQSPFRVKISGKRHEPRYTLVGPGTCEDFGHDLAKAQARALELDFAMVTEPKLRRVESGIYETELADGRTVRVERKNSKELRALAGGNYSVTKTGFAIFVNGSYMSMGFSLRRIQHDLSRYARR